MFRPVHRADQVGRAVLSEKVVWQLIKPYAEAAGAAGNSLTRHGFKWLWRKQRRLGLLLEGTRYVRSLFLPLKESTRRPSFLRSVPLRKPRRELPGCGFHDLL